MSNRLTTKWTPTSEGAYGERGAKGDRGEDFLMEVFSSWGWEAECYRGVNSRAMQVKGIDIWFKKPSWATGYTCDVKANIDLAGSFYVDTNNGGWLFHNNKNSHRIWHVNPDTGWMCWYGRDEMQRYIDSNGLRNTGLHKITVQDRMPFLTRRRAVIAPQQAAEEDVPF